MAISRTKRRFPVFDDGSPVVVGSKVVNPDTEVLDEVVRITCHKDGYDIHTAQRARITGSYGATVKRPLTVFDREGKPFKIGHIYKGESDGALHNVVGIDPDSSYPVEVDSLTPSGDAKHLKSEWLSALDYFSDRSGNQIILGCHVVVSDPGDRRYLMAFKVIGFNLNEHALVCAPDLWFSDAVYMHVLPESVQVAAYPDVRHWK